MKNYKKYTVVFAITMMLAATVHAQEEYFKVYQFETPYKGHLELTNWTSIVGKSSDETYDHYGKFYTRNGLVATSMEVEYGVTDHFVLAGYADFDDPKNGHFNYARSRIEARYRFGERFDNFVNTTVVHVAQLTMC